MDVENWVGGIKDVVTVKQVFGEPYEKDGVTVIPVASVRGGGGGGGGKQNDSSDVEASGSGIGMGFMARPAGVYVIKDGNVKWQPAVNVNRVIAGGQLLAGAVLTGVIGKKKRGMRHRRHRG